MVAIIIILIAFSAYLGTLCPTVYLGDSGELTAAAFSLGIPHNSGYPLYAILGKLFCLIPIGNIGFRINLMSSCFATITVWLVYSLIVKITSSKVSGFIGALVLAFVPTFWLQTVSSEVYALHTFFVALLIRLLWWWDERRDFSILLLFVFITGISFGNHLQTVMLAPGVFFIILSGDRKAVLNPRHFFIISLFFVAALSIYLYLPIRTGAEAAIHWGDPDSVGRFLAHVTGKAHREAYVMSKTAWEYAIRTKDVFVFVWSQFGILLLFSALGWVKVRSRRWKVFFGLVIVFDFVYTIFLNIVSLKVTAFTLPTSIVLSLLMGIGIAYLLRVIEKLSPVNTGLRKFARSAFCLAPALSLVFNYGFCDQSRNYLGYEQAVNIFRTIGTGDILFVHGDNYAFPVTYGRIVERMREDVEIYDRLSAIFKMPSKGTCSHFDKDSWDGERRCIEQSIIEGKRHRDVFYGVFNPYAITMRSGFRLVPYGLLHWVTEKEEQIISKGGRDPWCLYSMESFRADFERDFMSREVSGYFYFRQGESQVLSGQIKTGLKNIHLASEIGYDDIFIHSDMGVFLTDHGFLEDAREELEKALVYYDDLSKVYNNWGYFYHKIGEYENAAASFRKAIELNPANFGYYNNMGFALYEAGRTEESLITLKKSLSIKENQPEILRFIEEHLLAAEHLSGQNS